MRSAKPFWRATGRPGRLVRSLALTSEKGGLMPNIPNPPTIEAHVFAEGGRVPNNPSPPLMVYRGVLETGPGCAAACEALFAANDWRGAWRNGIYAHHHYHSTRA